MNYYTIEEVAKHNTEKDCWVIANDNVYDLTLFLNFHPAGKKIILKHGGTDQTDSYHFHGKTAKSLWKNYKIGKIRYSQQPDDCWCLIS